MKEIYLIDGSSYVYRAFYAMRALNNSKGLPTNAVYILTRMLIKLIKDKAPEHMAFVLDPRGPTHRHEKYEEYKATRQKMPEALSVQFPYILDVVKALGIPIVQIEKWEADDVIAALARKLSDTNKVVIISGDKDLMQLVGGNVVMWDTLKDTLYDPAGVEKKFGVGPEYIADLLAIMGDSSDNIPGIPGIGEKGALELVKTYGHIEDIIKKADTIKPEKLRRSFSENIDKAIMSLELVKLDHDVPVETDMDGMKLKPGDQEELLRLFTELEFKGLMPEAPVQQSAPVREIKIEQGFPEEFKGIAGFYSIAGIGCCLSDGKRAWASFDDTSALRILSDPSAEIIIHDAKEAIVRAGEKGITTKAGFFDVMLAAYCIDAANNSVSLETLASSRLEKTLPSIKDFLGSGKNARHPGLIPDDEKASFLAAHAEALVELKEGLYLDMKKAGVEKLFSEIEMPLTFVLAGMEGLGILVDKSVLAKLSVEITEQISLMENEIYGLAGKTFNINSPMQLGRILFEDLGLPVIKKTKTGASTDSAVLENLAEKHDLPAKILEYRGLFKLKNTYVDTLPEMIDKKTGRVHTKLNQAVTATGRISSSDPNLQNIPIRSAIGRRIREAFIPAEGFTMLSADYSQIELRILAHITKDRALVESFMAGIDIHTRTASEVFGVALNEVTPDMRRYAKTINFGIIYGMGPHKLSVELGIKQSVAKQYIDNYLAKYPGVGRYMEEMSETASSTGYVTTLLGRRRSLPEINSRNFSEREGARRMAINTPIQGTAADIIKIAMINIQKRIKTMKSRMILQVHDELLFEAAFNELEELKVMVKHEMENAFPLDVPVIAELGSGGNWAEAH
jgi:DNA polymerase-1